MRIVCFSGSHRPLWAVYGEYQFLPRQRWIHNLEHGAVVMLYHPCANKNQVQLLKKIVKMCLYRHIITPYNLLTPERVIIKFKDLNLNLKTIFLAFSSTDLGSSLGDV